MKRSEDQSQKNAAVIYLRVSSEEQVDNFSLDTQEGICKKEAEKRKLKICKTFREEGRSAKNIDGRPQLINLLEFCRKNKSTVSAVIIYRLDRISRQTSDYLAIRRTLGEYGITVISATEPTGDTPTEKLVETMLAGFAQLDNDIRGERARNGLRARFLSGLISGKPPIGYIFQAGYAVKDPETYDKVRQAWDLMLTGTKGLAEMASLMNSWGLYQQKGKKRYPLRAQTTQRIFRQKFYMGIITSRKYPDEVKGQHVSMITEQEFYKVQAILDGRNVSKIPLAQRDKLQADFPLRRIVKCANCGAGLTASWSRGKLGTKYGYYRCSDKCTTKSTKDEKIESNVISLLKNISAGEEGVNIYVRRLMKSYQQSSNRLQAVTQNADDEINRLKELRKTLVEKNLDGVYSDEIFKEQNEIIEEKMLTAQIAKDQSTIKKYDIVAITDFIKTKLADLGETYKKSNTSQVKVLLGSVFESGLAMDVEATTNYKINAIYRQILDKKQEPIPLGGGGGIRTHEALASSRFPGVCNRPLCDTSSCLKTTYFIMWYRFVSL